MWKQILGKPAVLKQTDLLRADCPGVLVSTWGQERGLSTRGNWRTGYFLNVWARSGSLSEGGKCPGYYCPTLRPSTLEMEGKVGEESWRGRSYGWGGTTAGEEPQLDLKVLGGSWWDTQVLKDLLPSRSQLRLPGHTGSGSPSKFPNPAHSPLPPDSAAKVTDDLSSDTGQSGSQPACGSTRAEKN